MLLVAVIAILVVMSALGIRLCDDAPPAQRRPVYERAARAPEPQSGRATPSITVPELSHDADYADDDDYATGYDDGYEQGEEDAAYGSYGDGYDDNHGGAHYSSGYDDGYEDGFNDY